MSTYWDVYCLDCDKGSGLHLNHGDDICRGLIPFRNALAAMANAEGLTGATEINITVPGEIGRVDPAWYEAHAGHVLAAVSEYGNIDGDCNQFRHTSATISDGAVCRLSSGHDGDHDFHFALPWSPEWEAVRRRAAERRKVS